MKKVLAFDIDGVITLDDHGYNYQLRLPNKDTIKKINNLFDSFIIILYTSRNIVDKYITEEWLKKYEVKYHSIIFDKPKYDLMIDDKVMNFSTDWYSNLIQQK